MLSIKTETVITISGDDAAALRIVALMARYFYAAELGHLHNQSGPSVFTVEDFDRAHQLLTDMEGLWAPRTGSLRPPANTRNPGDVLEFQ